MERQRVVDLQERLIDFAVQMIDVVERLGHIDAGRHIGSQLLRSGTSPASNYGEAQGAESKPDFVHKMSIALKELRETHVWLKIVHRKGIGGDVQTQVQECNELIAIFVKSITTAKRNLEL